jgi:hypothetical protein
VAAISTPLDWQCGWPELRSIQCSEALALLLNKVNNTFKVHSHESVCDIIAVNGSFDQKLGPPTHFKLFESALEKLRGLEFEVLLH